MSDAKPYTLEELNAMSPGVYGMPRLLATVRALATARARVAELEEEHIRAAKAVEDALSRENNTRAEVERFKAELAASKAVVLQQQRRGDSAEAAMEEAGKEHKRLYESGMSEMLKVLNERDEARAALALANADNAALLTALDTLGHSCDPHLPIGGKSAAQQAAFAEKILAADHPGAALLKANEMAIEALEAYENALDACGAGSGPEIDAIQRGLEKRFDELRGAALRALKSAAGKGEG